MGIQTGTTKILYNPSAANWAARTFALYMRQVQFDELDIFINPTTLKVRDPAEVTPAVAERSVRSLTRRRYPGGPNISVPATTRKVVVGPSIKLQAWPGRPITLERPKAGGSFDPEDADVPMKVLQLTIDGRFSDFYQFCQSANRIGFILRTNHGRPIYIAADSTP